MGVGGGGHLLLKSTVKRLQSRFPTELVKCTEAVRIQVIVLR